MHARMGHTNDDNETQVTLLFFSRAICKRSTAMEKAVWKTQAQDVLTEKSAVSEPHPVPVHREV